MQRKLFIIPVLILWVMTACDSGDIYPKDESKEVFDIEVNAAFSLVNTEAFPENYNIILGTFIGTSPYPTSHKVISKTENGKVNISLTEVPKGTTSIRLCLTDKVENKAIYSFFQYPLSGTPQEDIDIPEETINLAPFGRVQNQVFSQCLLCHGNSSTVSGNLKLTEEFSYSQLINIASEVSPSKMRVTPDNVQNSFLIDVLEDATSARYDHTKITTLKLPDDIVLIKNWIENGALKE